MKIEDVRNLAKKRNIPSHIIDRFITGIELDENAEVKDETTVLFAVNELAYNVDCVRANLEAAKKIRERRKENKKAGE